jgi:hypothetical protein
MRKSATQSFIASVEDEYIDRMEEIAGTLRSKGCVIHEVLELSGVITGEAKMTLSFKDLHIEGIASIEKQRILKKQ